MFDSGQAACSACPRAGARGGARACSPGCVRIFSMTGCSRIAAMIFNSPPQFGQCSRSSSNTRLSSRAQLSRTGLWCTQFASHVAGFVASAPSPGSCGTTRARILALGASTPCKRIRCSRGLGTSDRRSLFDRPCGQALHELQRRHHQVSGAVAPGGLELQHDLPCCVALHPFVGERRAGDVAAKLLQRFAVVGVATHSCVQAETVHDLIGGGNPARLAVNDPGSLLSQARRDHYSAGRVSRFT